MDPEGYMKTFRKNLKNLRAVRNLNQAQLAERAGVYPSVVRRIESGEREPLLSTICRLAGALGVVPAELLIAEMDEHAGMVGVTTFAKERGVSTGRIRTLAIAGRIEGARKVGKFWWIPENARVLPAEYRTYKITP